MDNSKFIYKYDLRYVINDSLSRISILLRDEKYIEKLMMSTQLPYIFTKEPIPMEFEYKSTELMFKETYSKFSWVLINKNIPSPILITFNLTENTLEKNLLLILEIELVKPELIAEKIVYAVEHHEETGKIGKEGHKLTEKEFNCDYQAKRIIEIFRKAYSPGIK